MIHIPNTCICKKRHGLHLHKSDYTFVQSTTQRSEKNVVGGLVQYTTENDHKLAKVPSKLGRYTIHVGTYRNGRNCVSIESAPENWVIVHSIVFVVVVGGGARQRAINIFATLWCTLALFYYKWYVFFPRLWATRHSELINRRYTRFHTR